MLASHHCGQRNHLQPSWESSTRSAETPAPAQEQDNRGGCLLFWTVAGLGAVVAVQPKSKGFTVQGSVLLGPLVEGHGLSVAIYKADGSELGTAEIKADGTYTLKVSQNYSGVILVRVVDESDGHDYRDEASQGLRDLSADLRVMQIITGQGTYTINLNGLTELAVRKAGLAGGDAGSSVAILGEIAAQQVTAINTQIADAFGLNGVDLVKTSPVAIINADGSDNHANADNYGRVLAALSGLELGTQQTTDEMLEDLANQIDSSGQLSNLGTNQLVAGALNVPTLNFTSFATQLGLSEDANAISDAWAVILAAADGTDNNAPKPTQIHYETIGVDSAVKVSLLGDVIDVKVRSAVDALVEVQDLADAVSAVVNGAAGGTGPTAAQLQLLGLSNVTANNQSAVQAAIERTANDGTGVDTLSELQSVVNTTVNSMNIISGYTGSNTIPSLTDYSNIGVTGVTGGNLAAINTAIALLSTIATDSQGEVQVVVNGYQAILAAADGNDNNATSPTQAQYAAIGLTGVDSASKVSLLGDVIDGQNNAAVDTVAEVQALADAVSAVMSGATGGTGPTATQLQLLGLNTVTANNLSAVQAAIDRTANDGTGVDTLAELQALVNATTASMDIIGNYTGSNTPVPVLVDYSNISVTGVTNTNLAAINTAIALLSTAATDTQTEVQTVVNGYLAILAAADSNDNNATAPTQAQYAAIGVTGVDSANKVSLLGDVIDIKNDTAVDTVAEVQALAEAVSAVMAGAAGGAGPTLAQLQLLGLGTVTANNLSAIQSAIERTANDGTGVDTLSELQALLTTTITSLNIISEYTGTNTVPDLTDYTNVGVAGVNSGNLAAINTAVALLASAQTDSQAEVQAVVDGYRSILASADGTDNNAANPTQAQYAAIGVNSVNSAAKASLLGDVVDVIAATEVDTVTKVQALADVVSVIVSAADGVDNNPTKPTQTQYETLGVTGVDTAVELSLLGDVIDVLPSTAVDTIAKLQALAQAVTAVMTGAAGGTAPSLAQLQVLGLGGITSSNLSVVQATIAATADDGTGVDTLPELQALTGATVSLDLISNYTGSNTVPALTDYGNIGVTDVTSGNLAAINTSVALLSTAVTDSQAKVQTAVNGYLAILAAADGTANNSTDPTQAHYVAIGVTGVDSTAKLSLLGDVIDANASTEVDTVAKVQALADAVAAVMNGAAGNTGPTVAQLHLLGFNDVTTNNLAAVRAAIAATADDGSGVDTLSELQTAVGYVASLDVISTYTGSNTAPALSDYTNITVTGVTGGNLDAINTAVALLSTAVTDTTAEVQTVVNGYLAILACADGNDNNATNPTQAQYTAIGVTGVNSAVKVSLLGDVIDVSASTAVDTVAKVQALADAVAAVMTGAGGGTGPTVTQLQLLGFPSVTANNLSVAQAAISATADDGSGVDTLAELQTVVGAIVSLDVISAYDGNNPAPAVADYGYIGVTGVTSGNLAAINTAIALLGSTDTDSQAEVQAVVTGYRAILTAADSTDNNATNPTQAQYMAIGVTDINSTAKVSLLGDVIDVSAPSAVDTVAEVQALANAVTAVMTGAAGGTAPTLSELQLLGVSNVTANNLSAVQGAIAATADNGTSVDTLSELQALVNGVKNALDVISAYTGSNTAPALTDYTKIAVSGVTSGNLAAINTSVALLSSTATDSQTEVQAVVDAYLAVLAGADGTDNNATKPTQVQYEAMGVTGMDTATELSLLGDVIDVKVSADVDTVAEVQALANAVAAVMTGAAGGSSPSTQQWELLGLSGISGSLFTDVRNALIATADDGSAVDTLPKLQALVNRVQNPPITAIQLSAVAAGSGGFAIEGSAGTSGFQRGNTSSIGDMNGDGLDDILIGVGGGAYVVYGRTAAPTTVVPGGWTVAQPVTLLDVNRGTGGFLITADGSFGYSASSAGDVNGDGIPDLVIGAPDAHLSLAQSITYSGKAYVVFGKTSGGTMDLSYGASGRGFIIEGQMSMDHTGSAVSSAGDVNGDGLADVIIGVPSGNEIVTRDALGEAHIGKVGGAYVVFGKTDYDTVKVSDVKAGTGGFVIYGAEFGGETGYSVSSAGDINGDGLADLIVGGRTNDYPTLTDGTPDQTRSDAGRTFVVFGQTGHDACVADGCADGLGRFSDPWRQRR
jgi:hypothetical protein